MLKLTLSAVTILLLALAAFSQGKPNDVINCQIRALGI